jgi:tetratricopeptide (TPR) repeat protein
LGAGERTLAEELWRELAQVAVRTQDATVLLFPLIAATTLAYLDGKIDAALNESMGLVAQASAAGSLNHEQSGHASAARLFVTLGAPEAALREFDDAAKNLVERDRSASLLTPWALNLLALLGRRNEALQGLDKAVTEGNRLAELNDAGTTELTHYLQAAILLVDLHAVEALLPFLETSKDLVFLMVGGGDSGPIARWLGAGERLLGQVETARGYYLQALEVCKKVRHRPETALTRLDLAELLLEHYPDERDAAIEHLDFAIAEFREMKMQPSLERALRHRGLLKA